MGETERTIEELLRKLYARTRDEARAAAVETAMQVVRSVFGHSGYVSDLQQQAIEASLHGRDVLALFPTGGGKSLCYQVPALCRPGTAVVISPLKALMRDQIDALKAHGVSAELYHSDLEDDERAAIRAELRSGSVSLVYVTPEMALMPWFMRILEGIELSLLAVDEAHCVSEWGHDFRPRYRQLGQFRQKFPGVPIIGVTATATQDTLTDIGTQLRMDLPLRLVAPLDRPNIRLAAQARNGSGDALELLEQYRGQSGIVYCLTQASTEQTAARLQRQGFRAEAFHADIGDGAAKNAIQSRFMSGETEVIVATSAFGMGIDKPDVRFVMNYEMPPSLEAYYQMAGRAGRDGLPADSWLIYGESDVATCEYFLRSGTDRSREAGHAKLEAIQRYAAGRACRRVALLRYFGERPGGGCGNCDCCDAGELADMHRAPALKTKIRKAKKASPRQGQTAASDFAVGDRVVVPGFGEGAVVALEMGLSGPTAAVVRLATGETQRVEVSALTQVSGDGVPLSVGDIVRHSGWGEGEVISLSEPVRDASLGHKAAVVCFASGDTKKILVSCLTRVGP